jgi:thioredoxin-like negative regulator of GroEL
MTRKAIRFTASWCGPCKVYANQYKQVSESRTDWEFDTIDIDSDPDKAKEYGIMSIPATVLEVDGKLIAKYTGVLQSSQLQERLNEWS